MTLRNGTLPIETLISNLVSTIIPVHNRPSLLQEAVASVLAQTHRPIEIIISDDGSTDDTPDVIRRLQASHPDEIVAFENPRRGQGPAREAGRTRARGEYIQYLDSDDLLLPEKFARQIIEFKRRPGAGIVYGITSAQDLEGTVLADTWKSTGTPLRSLFPSLLADRWWSTETPLYRRDVVERIGSWCDWPCVEDWEYEARAGALGVELAYVDEHVSVRRAHDGPRAHKNALSPQLRLQFFRTMIECAHRAGVTEAAPEYDIFRRWVFLNARQFGSTGDTHASRECYRLAGELGLDSTRYRLYGLACYFLGHVFMGKMTCGLDKLRAAAVRPNA